MAKAPGTSQIKHCERGWARYFRGLCSVQLRVIPRINGPQAADCGLWIGQLQIHLAFFSLWPSNALYAPYTGYSNTMSYAIIHYMRESIHDGLSQFSLMQACDRIPVPATQSRHTPADTQPGFSTTFRYQLAMVHLLCRTFSSHGPRGTRLRSPKSTCLWRSLTGEVGHGQ